MPFENVIIMFPRNENQLWLVYSSGIIALIETSYNN